MASFTFITGVSRGIGQGVATSLAKEGRSLIVTARAGAAAQKLVASMGTGHHALEVDVTRPETFGEVARRLRELDVRLSCVVHNAAVYERTSSHEAAVKTLTTNVFGPMRLNAVLAPFIEDGARVVLVSSSMGQLFGYSTAMVRRFESARSTAEVEALAHEYLAASAKGSSATKSADATEREGFARDPYSVSKALVNSLAQAWAVEHPTWSVVAASPGWVQTDMGGAGAPRTLEQGVSRIVEATQAPVRSGAFYADSGVFSPSPQ